MVSPTLECTKCNVHVQARWNSFHFLVQQLVGALVRLRISLNLALPLLPGAEIAKVLPASKGGPHGHIGEVVKANTESMVAKEQHGEVPQDVRIRVK